MGRLQGRSAIVTGAGRGIGREIAAKFLEEGARTLICDIVADRIERAGQELGADGEVLALAGDVTDPAFCDELVARAVERFGRLDILINNAGIGFFEPFLEHTEDSWDRTINTNLKSMFLLGQRAARAMVEQGDGGAIVNMSSSNGHAGEPLLTAYNVSKAGVILLTKTMAVELAPYNIRVNCVSPGFIRTEIAQEAGADEEYIQGYLEKIPLGRYGAPREVANVFAFLASDEASFVTGESVLIDGGELAKQ